MRKVVILEHISLDGIIQGPGDPNEDTTGDFGLGGWIGDYSDEVLGSELKSMMNSEFDLLLGRKTYDIWAPYWSVRTEVWPQAAKATKYVASRSLLTGTWIPTKIINTNLEEEVRRLASESGNPLHIWGSSNMVQTLLRADLVDELWLMIYPILIGKGKRLFQDGNINGKYQLRASKQSSKGVVISSYIRVREEIKENGKI